MRRIEVKALRIRQFAGATPYAPINPYDLARRARLRVIPFKMIDGLSEEARTQLLELSSAEWSGGTSSPLADGSRLVILNPTQAQARHAVTLMEEICHVFLGHRANRIGDHGLTFCGRDYSAADEREAYAVGAAVLLPFHALDRAVERRTQIAALARHYRVSQPLVRYRLQVLRLWPAYRDAEMMTNRS
jgi:hypothetical protein